MQQKLTITASVAAIFIAGVASAGGHDGNPAVKARKAYMQLYAFNMGTLGAMAKGAVAYDAETAQAAADNMAALKSLNTRNMWIPGTSTDDLGDETAALPAIWQEGSEIGAISAAFGTSIDGLAAVAGDGKDAMAAALGGVGGNCSACHKAFRKP